MDNRAIGVFDSGLGGLTAVQALREIMPNENIIYFADSGRVPYGPRPVKQLRLMARQDMELVASFGVKAIIAACGTVSSNAADVLSSFEVPVFGVLRPSVEAMGRIPGSAPLGIIATEASIKSGAFQSAVSALCPGREIVAVPCPDFVTLIESGHREAKDPAVQEAVERYLRPMKEKGVSALLLGCTHFGIISEAIKNYLGEDTELVSASRCAAEELSRYIEKEGISGGCGKISYYTSGSKADFDRAAGLFLATGSISATAIPPMEVE